MQGIYQRQKQFAGSADKELQNMEPKVVRLEVHLEGKHIAYFEEGNEKDAAQSPRKQFKICKGTFYE